MVTLRARMSSTLRTPAERCTAGFTLQLWWLVHKFVLFQSMRRLTNVVTLLTQECEGIVLCLKVLLQILGSEVLSPTVEAMVLAHFAVTDHVSIKLILVTKQLVTS